MFTQIKILGILVAALMWGFTSAAQAASPPPQQAEAGQEYVVQADDWLTKLAEKYLGDATLWRRIVEATNARAAQVSHIIPIENPNLIYTGQTIFIPAGVSTPARPAVEAMSLANLCDNQQPALRAFCSEIPLARVHFDPHENAEFFTCASRAGLENLQLDPQADVVILVPNDGDFDLKGITTAIKVAGDKAVLIPRWPGSKFDFSAEFAEQFGLPAGEQLEIPLAKALDLVTAGDLIWTGKHGAPGKAGLFQTDPPLTCDPQADFEIETGPFNPKG